MDKPTIGLSNFARGRHQPDSGNSYFARGEQELIALVLDRWGWREAGDGEDQRLDRKVLVPVDADGFFCPPRAKLMVGMSVQSEVVIRQEGEAPFVDTFITPIDAKEFGAIVEVRASFVEIILYSADALLENNGERSTDCDWEIVCLSAQVGYKTESMLPLTMARNQLGKPGGTAGSYTSQEYADSIWYHATKGITVRKPK